MIWAGAVMKWAGAVMIWAGAVMIWAGACSKKNYPTLDRWTDLLTSMVTYRDANVFYNSLKTLTCATLPLNSLKNAKKAKRDRQTDGPTDQHGDL